MAYLRRDKPGDKTEDKAKTMVQLAWWMTHEGQKYAEPMQYAPLSKKAVEKAEALIKSITYNGKKQVISFAH